jgi:hypothetical protein
VGFAHRCRGRLREPRPRAPAGASARERWYVLASVRNMTNTDYFTPAFIQSNPGYPRTYEAGFGLRF